MHLPELTLALRRSSDKLTLAEDALRTRTAQFVDVQGAAGRAQYAAEAAFGVAERARADEEEALVRERAMLLRLRVAEEEGRMMDRTVGEYADLVRALERRQSLPSSPPPSRPQPQDQDQPPLPPPKEPASHAAGTHASNGKRDARQDRGGTSTLEAALEERFAELHKLAEEFGGTSEALRIEICRLQGELEDARAELEAERNAAKEERVRLSDALTELELLKHDDNAAAKMVSRYMYVQSSSPTLPSPPLSSSQEVLPIHNGHSTKGARGTRSAARSHDVHAAHPARLGAGRAREGTAAVHAPARRAGRGDGAARTGDLRPTARDRAAACRRRAGGPAGGGAPAVAAARAGDVRQARRAGRAEARRCRVRRGRASRPSRWWCGCVEVGG